MQERALSDPEIHRRLKEKVLNCHPISMGEIAKEVILSFLLLRGEPGEIYSLGENLLGAEKGKIDFFYEGCHLQRRK